ncbi:hypothetical protein MKY04_12675 [Lysinibacillus telephonicus]|uniref:hypothetical protein n=1 Tax=Lysinibacillus telephonicus TaxID=1714840 RepID=UPI0031FC5E25
MELILVKFIEFGGSLYRYEKYYDSENVPFIPRKGDMLKDEGLFEAESLVSSVEISIEEQYIVINLEIDKFDNGKDFNKAISNLEDNGWKEN